MRSKFHSLCVAKMLSACSAAVVAICGFGNLAGGWALEVEVWACAESAVEVEDRYRGMPSSGEEPMFEYGECPLAEGSLLELLAEV